MADDRLPCCRSLLIAATRFDKVISRAAAISFSAVQNASSMVTLVLLPAMATERREIGDRALDDRRFHSLIICM